MKWNDRITIDVKVLAGKPVIRGTRISVQQILDMLGSGAAAEDLLRDFPHLKQEDILACIQYAADAVRDEIVHPAAS